MAAMVDVHASEEATFRSMVIALMQDFGSRLGLSTFTMWGLGVTTALCPEGSHAHISTRLFKNNKSVWGLSVGLKVDSCELTAFATI